MKNQITDKSHFTVCAKLLRRRSFKLIVYDEFFKNEIVYKVYSDRIEFRKPTLTDRKNILNPNKTKTGTGATTEDFSGLIENWENAINLGTEDSLALFEGQTVLINGSKRTVNSVEVNGDTVTVEYDSSDPEKPSRSQDFNKLNFYRSIADTMTGDEKKTINQKINRIISKSKGDSGEGDSGEVDSGEGDSNKKRYDK